MSNIIERSVFGKIGIPLMSKLLDVSSLRHKLIAGNIANVSTPGYKSKDVDFHGELQKAAGNQKHLEGVRTNAAHLPVGKSTDSSPEIIVDKKSPSNGINNVDMDKEVAGMAENQIMYSIGARLLAMKFDGLRSAIKSK
ncbi:MAG: flagellar basal body rod protein FlgB [Candidatus Zixiibacteriota bacterium]